jgi:hypothetical protein
LASSSATRSDVATVGDWLGAVARRLGTADPSVHLGDVLEATFPRPLADPTYRRNALVPGGWPLEVSFSEGQPDRLRIDLQPADVECPPVIRRDLALAVARRHAGPDYRERCETWLPYTTTDRFGAFLAAGFGPDGLTAVKTYLEFDRAIAPDTLPGSLGAAAALVAEHVPDVVPHLVAVSSDGTERLYLACPGGLRILALDGLLARFGVRHRMPGLAASVATLTGGRLLLPEDAALIAIGLPAHGLALKVELLPDALAGTEATTLAAIERLLLDRPPSLAAFRRWRHAVGAAVVTGVVSVRLTGDEAPRLNVYQRIAAPHGLHR